MMSCPIVSPSKPLVPIHLHTFPKYVFMSSPPSKWGGGVSLLPLQHPPSDGVGWGAESIIAPSIYYYTPLPLNLVTKQQQSTISMSAFFFGHYSILALGTFSELTRGIPNSTVGARNSAVAVRGIGAKSGGALQNLRSFGAQTAVFGPTQSRLGAVLGRPWDTLWS